MIIIKGLLDDEYRAVFETKVSNGGPSIPIDLVIDSGFTGFDGDVFLGIPKWLVKSLALEKADIPPIKVYNPLARKPVECDVVMLNMFFVVNGTERKIPSMRGIDLPGLGNEALAGPDFLISLLFARRLIFDYDDYSVRLIADD